MNGNFQSIAILPAAGRSRRMGRPKLLLPVRGATMIEQVIRVWSQSTVDHVVTVVRKDDLELASRCRSAGAAVVLPAADPAEMRFSVEAGLDFARRQYAPRPTDAWLLSPADVPGISVALIDALLRTFREQGPAIYVPSCNGRRGHPVVFPWSLASCVTDLAEDEGLNSLLRRNSVSEVCWEKPDEWDDVDTPAEYRRVT
jgi:molybdenum cofactor cytidylyltransferase